MQVGTLGRRRDHRVTHLHGPGQRDLCRRRLVVFCDLLNHRIVQHFAIGQGHVGGDPNAVGGSKIHDLAVLQVGVQFDLVGGDIFGAHSGNRLFHQVQGEIGNTDLARQAQTLGFQ